MASEIYIPIHLVPPEILQKLKEIGLPVQSESGPSTHSPSPSTSHGTPGSSLKKGDERDDLEGSGSQTDSVVHVLCSAKAKETGKESDVVSLFDQNKNSDVVSVFDPNVDNISCGSYEQRHDADPPAFQDRLKDNDVVSLFDPRSSPSIDRQPPGPPRLEGRKENEAAVFDNRSSPLKDALSQTPRSSSQTPHPQPHASPMQTCLPVCSQSGPHYSALSYPHQAELHEQYVLHSQKHQQSSPFQPLSVQEAEERRGVASTHSPCKIPKRYEDTAKERQSAHAHHSESPSVSEASSSLASVTASSSPQSGCSRSSPSQRSCSIDDDFPRGIPAGPVTPSEGQKSPKVLTPPETPENDGKRVVPEVFTFDDLTCSEERMRQMWERLCKLQGQFTPTKRSPSTPRHPPSTPTTPSYRRQEVLPSPTVRRISPVDHQHFLQLMEAATSGAGPPPSKLKTPEMPSSPVSNLPSTSQRLSVDEYPQQRLDSLSPKPKKRLVFDGGEAVCPQMLQAQPRLRNFDASASPYPSPRPSGSGSENPFPFPTYPLEGQPFGRGSPAKAAAVSLAEFQKKMTSLAAIQESKETAEQEDEEDERGGPFFSSTRHIYESIEFPNRVALQNGRYTPKRKRSEPMDDGNDGMAMCTCAAMERNFLQMAECAYKRIRRIDASPADFDRFRNELAQTNEILRESMGLMKHIRDLCDHRKRPRW